MLDNIPHIKAYWIMMTPGVAQIAQRFGANDIDGTVVEEKIYHDAGATTAQHLRRQDLLRLIREAGRGTRGTRHGISSSHSHGICIHGAGVRNFGSNSGSLTKGRPDRCRLLARWTPGAI